MLVVEVATVPDAAHDDGEERGEGAHDDGLALYERQVADHHRPRLLLRVHVAEVGMRREARGERHLEVALQTQQRGHEDEQLVHHIKYLLQLTSNGISNSASFGFLGKMYLVFEPPAFVNIDLTSRVPHLELHHVTYMLILPAQAESGRNHKFTTQLPYESRPNMYIPSQGD